MNAPLLPAQTATHTVRIRYQLAGAGQQIRLPGAEETGHPAAPVGVPWGPAGSPVQAVIRLVIQAIRPAFIFECGRRVRGDEGGKQYRAFILVLPDTNNTGFNELPSTRKAISCCFDPSDAPCKPVAPSQGALKQCTVYSFLPDTLFYHF